MLKLCTIMVWCCGCAPPRGSVRCTSTMHYRCSTRRQVARPAWRPAHMATRPTPETTHPHVPAPPVLPHPVWSAFMGAVPTRAPAREATLRGISRGLGRSGLRVFWGRKVEQFESGKTQCQGLCTVTVLVSHTDLTKPASSKTHRASAVRAFRRPPSPPWPGS